MPQIGAILTNSLSRVNRNASLEVVGKALSALSNLPNCASLRTPVRTTIPNIESLEDKIPVLFLYRRLRKDSGGPGKFRGGLAGEFMLKPHRIDSLSINAFHIGKWYPALGLHGGYPGATAWSLWWRWRG